ncbi:hypothetical protein AKJ09_03597 [Labilithrix luteola]|jgi:hypothetical protein|uniref:Uncharacterized protein n=1 Tax=Labilithrix luteola TaxID=1391654 RepID=A0A0K1PTR2_9BACT|nr:hypothetical protein [Labilithrix luteola]AKU96933.1 hypothetical protein AKJ09_03597 [Labilithrix luteola]
MADTKFSTFITENKLNPARIIAVSHKLETLQRSDRDLKLAKRQSKGEGADKKEAPAGKPRSGRSVTQRALNAALSGKATISGPTKQRILRAVNHVLEQKKKDKVELKTLF